MRAVLLLVVALVAGCGPSADGQRAVGDSRASQQAEGQEGYVPKPQAEADERPWASAFVNHSLEQAGVRGTADGRALSWLGWGVRLRRPVVGAVAVLDYGHGRGHVGFVAGTHNGMIVLIGGDQSNEVNQTAFAPGDITAYRWPAGRPVPASAPLPNIRPKGATDAASGSRRAEVGSAVTAADSIEYRTAGGEQTLRMRRLADDRVRFELQVGSCRRTVSGIAYEIYPGDAQIDAEAGIGYPAREYFFWADSVGSRGVSIRLSIAGPPRARVLEWGYPEQCPHLGSVLHGDARPERASDGR
jgi:uncharacterized protein (TIGR02594 family)